MINCMRPDNMKLLELEKWRDLYFDKKVSTLDSEYNKLAYYFNKFSVNKFELFILLSE